MYNKTVLDHFQNPRNLRKIDNASAIGTSASRVCGDIMDLYLKIDGGKITDASFIPRGCGAAIASGSVLTELIKGKTVEDAATIQQKQIIKELGGLPKIKEHCGDLAVDALSKALKDFREHDTKKPKHKPILS